MTHQPKTLIAVDEGEFQSLIEEVAKLRRAVESVTMAPRPEWVTIAEFAEMRGKTSKTIRNWINAGTIETKREGSVTLVRVT